MRRTIATTETFIISVFGSLTKNMQGWVGMNQTFCGDGTGSVRGQVGMDRRSVGTGEDGTKIPSLCTPLMQSTSRYLNSFEL